MLFKIYSVLVFNLLRESKKLNKYPSQVPQPEASSRDPSNKVYFIAAQLFVIKCFCQMLKRE